MALLCVEAAHQTSRLAADMYGRSVSANRGGTVGGSGRDSRGHGGDSLARTRQTTSRSGTKGRTETRGGWKDTREKPRGRPRSPSSCRPGFSAYCVTAAADGVSEAPRTSHGEARARARAQVRSGSERYVTNMTAGGVEKKKHISVVLSPQKRKRREGKKNRPALNQSV